MSRIKHSMQGEGEALLEAHVLQTVAAWHQIPQHHTLAPELRRHCFIHHQASNPLSLRRPPLPSSLSPFLSPAPHFVFFYFSDGGGGGEGKRRRGRGGWGGGGATTQELSPCSSSFFLFFCFLWKMYSVVSCFVPVFFFFS
ncbi:uncharacterized protein V6R79_002992 [Siganus canaliculatus]